MGVDLHAPHGHLVRARLLRRTNDLDAAEASLGSALETAWGVFAQMGATTQAERLARELAS